MKKISTIICLCTCLYFNGYTQKYEWNLTNEKDTISIDTFNSKIDTIIINSDVPTVEFLATTYPWNSQNGKIIIHFGLQKSISINGIIKVVNGFGDNINFKCGDNELYVEFIKKECSQIILPSSRNYYYDAQLLKLNCAEVNDTLHKKYNWSKDNIFLSELTLNKRRGHSEDSALSLLRNPYALLGEESSAVLDPEQHEQSLADAGIYFHHFRLEPQFDAESGKIATILLHLSPISRKPPPDETLNLN